MKSITSVDYVGFVWQAYWGWFGISIRHTVFTLQWMAEEQIGQSLTSAGVGTKPFEPTSWESPQLILWRIILASTETSPTRWFGVDWGVGVAGRVSHACPPPPEEATQDAALERLQQGALPCSGVSEQFQFNPGLDSLSGPKLLDVAQFVVVLREREQGPKAEFN